MGVHLGPVVVGDIGTASRINYTIVGDAVNATSGSRALARPSIPMPKLLLSSAKGSLPAAPAGFQFIERGAHLVKGKQESLKVFQLIGGPEESTSAATVGPDPWFITSFKRLRARVRRGSIAPNAARVLQQRMSVAARKRLLATKVRCVVKGQYVTSANASTERTSTA